MRRPSRPATCQQRGVRRVGGSAWCCSLWCRLQLRISSAELEAIVGGPGLRQVVLPWRRVARLAPPFTPTETDQRYGTDPMDGGASALAYFVLVENPQKVVPFGASGNVAVLAPNVLQKRSRTLIVPRLCQTATGAKRKSQHP
ncbi:hypothetical protein NDU88_004910 [Pleurodeles waltl]|uniref:Uncharacterized protein n=1 Tax=Pleurodeles waltl TaxID=8319 RepID=A0AAV7UHF2_PLEWA|nr:hypothetical protein NDU88_004910 [Pleurodeles waltl]